jgi:DNA/RNA-binding domain of Phe-tRNA-synthetase-like protein
MSELKDVLQTEFSEEFIDKMKNRMITSYYKYGKVADNYGKQKRDAIKNLEKRIRKYQETGNTEWLIDAANFTMIEFMYPQHENAHFKATNSEESPGIK